MKTTKRIVVILLICAMLLGMVPGNVFAEETSQPATVNNNEITVNSSNGLGNMIAEDMEQDPSVAAQMDGNVQCKVVALTVSGGVAEVKFQTNRPSKLVAAIYTEDGARLVASGFVLVQPEDQTAQIQLEGEIPAFFMASAYLLDATENYPISTAYETSLYTKEMQQLLNSTVEDYAPELVLNLDEDDTTNFAVYSENTIRVQAQAGVNTVLQADDENMVYVIGNADETFTSLMAGDIVAYEYGNNQMLIAKVAGISVDGTTVTIQGADLELEEVFSHLKLEADGNAGDMIVDDSDMEDGMTFDGVETPPATKAIDGGGGLKETLAFSYVWDVYDGNLISSNVKLTAKLGIETRFDYYISWRKNHITFYTDVSLTGSFNGNVKFEKDIPIPKMFVSVAGVLEIGYKPEIQIKAEAKLSFELQSQFRIGIEYKTGNGFSNLSTTPVTTFRMEVEGELFFGIDLCPYVGATCDLVTLSMESPIGFTVNAADTGYGNDITFWREQQHGCMRCFSIKGSFSWDFEIKLGFLNNKLRFSRAFHILDIPLGRAYYSADFNEWGKGDCTRVAYKLIVQPVNSAGEALEDVNLTLLNPPNGQTFYYALNKNRYTFLPNGSYTVTAQKGDLIGTLSVDISGASKKEKLTMYLGGDLSDGLSWKLDQGTLMLVGTGAVPDYAAKTSAPWYPYRDQISKLVVSNGITAIGKNAFADLTRLTVLDMGATVKKIGSGAFSGCSGLPSLTIPKACTQIDSGAFSGCTGLTQVHTVSLKDWLQLTFANSTANPLYYAGNLYVGDALLTNLELPEGVTQIKNYAFYGCTGLISATFGSQLTGLGTGSFGNCSNLTSVFFECAPPTIASGSFTGVIATAYYPSYDTAWTQAQLQNYGGTLTWTTYKTVTKSGSISSTVFWRFLEDGTLMIYGSGSIPGYSSFGAAGKTPWDNYLSRIQSIIIADGITTIGAYPFYGCTNLTSVTIPDSVTSIGNYAFEYCSGLTSITIPDSVTSIGDHAFRYCSSLTSVTIGDSVTSIGTYAFDNCTSLTSVTIPDSVTRIDTLAFQGCSNLKSVWLGKGVKVFPANACTGCENLQEIWVDEENSNYSSDAYGILYNKNKTVLTRVPEGFSGTCTIPESVTKIEGLAFCNCKNLISVTIPDSVTSIGDSAFSGCSSLADITIPDSVTSIGYSAFSYCKSLTSITIPDSVTSIGSSAFRYCSSLTSVTIGDSVTSIGMNAFQYCSSLTSVTIGESVTRIDTDVFSNCSSLTDLTIPDSVTRIGDYAFEDCSSLRSITIPDSVTSIGMDAFYNCSSLTSITIPDSVTSIGSSAFRGCSSLKDITIPFVGQSKKTASDTYQYPFGYIFGTSSYDGGVATEQSYYGSGTSSTTYSTYYIPATLKSVTVTGGEILYGAFYNCSGLTSITIGDGVTSIGDSAFWGCSSLEDITIPFVGQSKKTASDTYQYPFGYIFGTSCYDGGVATKQYYYGSSTSSETYSTYYIPATLKSVTVTGGEILHGAFYNCSGLTSITIPDSVTNIGAVAFWYCSSLTDITIPDRVTSIGSSAFSHCSSLTSITIPDSVTSISYGTFEYCSSLTSITIPDSVTSIGNYAFYYCSSLTSITIPDSVTSISYGAFYSCNSLTSITIPDSVTSIGNFAFYSCSSLTSVTIGDGVTSIGDYAFYYCSSLTSITIPDSVTSIGKYAFAICSNLRQIYWKSPTQSVAASAFSNVTATVYYDNSDGSWTQDKMQNYGGTLTWVEMSAMQKSARHSMAAAIKRDKPVTRAVISGNTGNTGKRYTANFNGLQPGVEYLFVAVRDPYLSEVLAAENLLYIQQYQPEEDGTLTVTYRLNETVEDSYVLVFGGPYQDLKDATITVQPVNIDNGEVVIDPVVVYNGTTLQEGVDYTLEGVLMVSEPGVYTCTAVGKGEYTGSVSCTYQAISDYSGTLTDTLSWTLTKDGVLSFTGTGAIPDFDTGGSPWYGSTIVKHVDIPAGITGIGIYAFENCAALTTVKFTGAAPAIGQNAFAAVTATATYPGDDTSWTAQVLQNYGGTITWKQACKHSWIEATCTEPKTCALCGDTKGAALGHTEVTDPAVPATCTTSGLTEGSHCSVCSLVLVAQTTVPATHNYVDGVCTLCQATIVAQGTCGTNLQWQLSSTGTLTISGTGYTMDAPWRQYENRIVSVVIGDGVTSIGKSAFSRCSSLTSVTIPDSVTSIGDYAFEYCSSLTSVTIPDSVTSIGDYAFRDCRSLTSVTIPDSVTSIGDYAFRDCRSLTSVTIGAGVKIIDNYAFYYCNSLRSITIPASITAINVGVFSYCKSLTSVTIPDSVTKIGDSAFQHCTSLTSVTIGTDVKIIDNSAFYNCSSLRSVTIPDSVTSIGKSAFSRCSSLSSVTIGDSVNTIGEAAFQGCNSLTEIMVSENNAWYSIGAHGILFNMEKTLLICAPCTITGSYTIPDSVTTICDYAFSCCSGLTDVTIPNGVTDIGYAAFSCCGNLESMTIPFVGASSKAASETAQYPLGYIFGDSSYAGSVAVKQYYNDNTTSINSNTYYIPKSLKSVTVTGGELFQGAFYDCYMLTLVTIGDDVTSIGDNAFFNCSSLTSVTIGDSVTRIGDSAFYNCSSLTSITIPDSVTSIGMDAFSFCYSLTSVVIGNGVTEIGYDAFYDCSNLTSVVIGSSVTSIAGGTFYGCSSLESMTIPFAGTSGKFAGDSWLFPFGDIFGTSSYAGSVAVEQFYYYGRGSITSSTKLTVGTFYIPASLKSVTVTGGEILYGAFYNCSMLTSVAIGADVTDIGDNAFYNCSNLSKVIYCGNESQWNSITIGTNNTALTTAKRQYHDWQNATCTAPKTCPYCGLTQGAALGHSNRSYTDNGDGTHDYTCGVCGAAELDDQAHAYTDGVCACGAKEPEAKPVLQGISRAKNLSLYDVIYIKTTVAFVGADGTNADISKADVLKNGRILFWSEKNAPADGVFTIDNATSVKKLTDGGVYKDGIQEYYAYSHGIAAAEYNDAICYCTYIVVDGVEYYGDVYEYSVVTYADNQFKKTNTKLKTMLAGMLNYGASAQEHFSYKTGALANAGLQAWVDAGQLTASDLELGWSDELLTTPDAATDAMSVNFVANNAKRTASSLVLKSMVQPKVTFAYNIVGDKGTKLPEGGSVTVYYWSGADYEALKAAGTALTADNATYVIENADVVESSSTKYGYEYAAYLEGIPAKQLGDAMYVAAVFDMGDGTQYRSGVSAYSPEVYAGNQLSKTTAAETLKTLLKWMIVYGERAKAYYG